MQISRTALAAAIACGLGATSVAALAQDMTPMVTAEGNYTTRAIFTVGETISGTTGALNPTTAGDYAPPGILDGLGAYQNTSQTIRILANHELLNFRGYPYEVSDGNGGTYLLTGSRVSYFDINRQTLEVVDAGLAINRVYDNAGNLATDNSFLANDFTGFSRFCSSVLVPGGDFGPVDVSGARDAKRARGIVDNIYFTGEEDGGFFNSVGGALWALDVETGDFWAVPAMGRGAWENITQVDPRSKNYVAFLLADDTSPFDFDGDGENEASPLFLYVGQKNPDGNFLERNGLAGGQLHVWVSDTGERSPLEFNGRGALRGSWVAVDNSPDGTPSEDGSTGFDEFGYPTQGNLWLQAKELGAFGFSRPEDLATSPVRGNLAALASTGVDSYAVDEATGNGADTFGTMYLIITDLKDLDNPTSTVKIMYDPDADATRALRSPDNLAWATDGFLYIQEDEAEEDTLSGDEVLFGPGAANPNEAGIVRMNPFTGELRRIANIDRSVVLDPSIANPTDAVDVDAGDAGEWESSGIIDISSLVGGFPGTTLVYDVQAHGIEDQTDTNAASRINDDDLVEGGQLLILERALGTP